MSTSNYQLNGISRNVVGNSYDAKCNLVIHPSLTDTFNTYKSFTPINGTVATTHSIDVNLSVNDDYIINQMYLEIQINNLDGTNNITIHNPWLLLSSITFKLNNQELVKYDSDVKIFSQVSQYYRQFTTTEEITTELQKIFGTSNPYNGITINGGGSNNYILYLPLMDVFIPQLKNIGRQHGLYKFSIEFMFKPNSNNAVSISQFIKSSANVNPYTSSLISFTNIKLSMYQTRHMDKILNSIPNPIIMIPKYEDRYFALTGFNTNSTHRINLSTDFSTRAMVQGILLYLYPSGITTYNDANACIYNGEIDKLGFELRNSSTTILKYDEVNIQRRINLYHFQSKRRTGNNLYSPLIDNSNDLSKKFTPLTFIDLQNVSNRNSNVQNVYSGISNGSDVELIITSLSNYGNAVLYVSLFYIESAQLESTGLLKYTKDPFSLISK
jgi:hypothetical protein